MTRVVTDFFGRVISVGDYIVVYSPGGATLTVQEVLYFTESGNVWARRLGTKHNHPKTFSNPHRVVLIDSTLATQYMMQGT